MQNSDPAITGEVEILLDQPRRIKFGNFTHFRLGRYSSTLGGEWNYYQLLVYIWAMLPKPALARFPDPESLSEFITVDNMGDYIESLIEAINNGTEPDAEKKRRSITGPSTASKSA